MKNKKRVNNTLSFVTLSRLDKLSPNFKSRSDTIDKAVDLLWKRRRGDE